MADACQTVDTQAATLEHRGAAAIVADRSRLHQLIENLFRDAGTGLGLNIVHEVVKGHNWTVHVDESAKGGARFNVGGVEFVE